ncbi:MAG TPA: DUF4860 domain-containing protein [Candidatus Dorea intestinavium]|nr:DUF4860 domain-containing protein [Candidatus Dorea intestinavium]
MNKKTSKHVIDLIFPIALFVVFMIASIGVLLISINFYTKNVEEIAAKEESRTALSYITTKIHRNDLNGGVSIDQIEGVDCLSLVGEKGNTKYHTYIYIHKGKLKELVTNGQITPRLTDGTAILDISFLEMMELSPGLFKFTVVDHLGHVHSQIIAERSS